MIQRFFFTVALFMLFAASPVCGQQSPEKAQQNVKQTNGVAADARANADDPSLDKQGIIQEILDAKYRVTMLTYRQEKIRRYIAQVRQSIEDLEYEKVELKKMKEQLRSYLKGVVPRLEDFIVQDLPFLPDERSKRVTGLYNSLDDPDLSLGELIRVVFEVGLGIETEYGRVVDASENETLNIGGVDTQVVIFRLGRIGMYYLSLDGTKTGFYNRVTGNWEPLPSSMNKEIKLAVKIGQRERTAEIVNLPLEQAK